MIRTAGTSAASPEDASAAARAVARAALDLESGTPWRVEEHGSVRLWIRGYAEGGLTTAVARALASPGVDALDAMVRLLARARGHFALAAETPQGIVAAVDWVRSIPLFHAKAPEHWRIDDRPERLRKRAGIADDAIDPDAALAVAMAGYTIDRATLYRGIGMLGPGECALFRPGAAPEIRRYYAYRPWRVDSPADDKVLRRLVEEITLDIVRRMIASLDGRMLVIPLSAGFDSRLIASACRHLGYDNVRCFAYGRSGNFEAAASRQIAERLGYSWRFVPYSITSQRRFFAGAPHRAYLESADSCASVPFEQDYPAIAALKEGGFIPSDAVIANGNSGDYISGMHIPPALRAPPQGLAAEDRKKRILGALSYKHFSLWRHLRTPSNIANIEMLLWRSIEAAGGALGEPDADHGLYEYVEFQDRQCKYVITGQRIYEALGHEWRLPLWDNAYLEFWELVPLRLKAGQALYAAMLRETDWGGVWRGIEINAKKIRPRWIVPLRLAAKATLALAGRDAWHGFERRYFQYWMDTTCASAVVPFRLSVRDRRGARHAVAWLAERYLAGKGVPLDRFAG